MSFKKNTAFLAVMMLIKKLLSIVYKIPYQNMTSDKGFYVFQQVYPIVGIYMLFGSFVFPIVISNLLNEHDYNPKIKEYIKKSLWTFSLIIFAILFLGNYHIALLMGDVLLAPIIRVSGISFLFLPNIAYLRGVLQSRPDTMKKIGYSVVVEQLSRVAITIYVLFFFPTNQNYQIAYYVYLFSLIAPVIALLHLYLLRPDDTPNNFLPLKEKGHFFRRSIYFFLSSGILLIFGLIDSFLVFNMLVMYDLPLDAMNLKGILERGLPLVQAATFFVSALVSMTMAQMDDATDEKQKLSAFNSGLFFILALGVPATAGLLLVMNELNVTLFINNAGTNTLRILALQVVFYALLVLTTAVLQKEKRQSLVLLALLIGIFTKLITTAPLTNAFSINGAAISSIISLVLMSAITVLGLRKSIHSKMISSLIAIIGSTGLMCFAIIRIRPFLTFVNDGSRIGNMSSLIFQTVIGIVIYFLSLLVLLMILRGIEHIFSKKEDEDMRLDKYLKVSRIIKRRQTAKEVSDAGKIFVNGKVAKSSTSVSKDDEITLHYAKRTLVIRVMDLKDSTKKEDAANMYEIVSETEV